MTALPTRPAWQIHEYANPVRQDLINQIDPWMNALADTLGLNAADPRQRLHLIQSLRVWTDDAAQAARNELGPDYDPLDRQPF